MYLLALLISALVVALFPDGTYVLPPGAVADIPSRRAKPGDTITFYGVGFGAVAPNIPAGTVVQQENTVPAFQIKFGSTPGTVRYAGLAPGAVGVYQFNVVVPPGVVYRRAELITGSR